LAQSKFIAPTKVKELNFFLEGRRNKEDYMRNVVCDGRDAEYSLEASPKYFLHTKEVACHVRDCLRDVKVVVLLRDPVKRAESIINHILIKRSPNKYASLAELLSLQIQPVDGEFSDDIDRNCLFENDYLSNIKILDEYFNAKNVGVFFYENIGSPEFMSDLASFIGVPNFEFDMLLENKTRQVRFPVLHKLAKEINDSFEVFFNRFPKVRSLVRSIYYLFNEKPRSVDSVFTAEQASFVWKCFSDKNEGLVGYLDARESVYGVYPKWLEGKSYVYS
jgi:hypothetical protein